MKTFTNLLKETADDVKPAPISKDKLIYNTDMLEDIASLLHDQWMDMAKGLIKKGEISQETQDRWQDECFKPYDELSDSMQEIDRVFARRIISYLDIKGYNII